MQLINSETMKSGRYNRTVHANLALILQIALVCDNDDWERVLILDTENLLMECANFLERVPRGYGIYQQETFSCSHVLLAHGPAKYTFKTVQGKQKKNLRVFFLTSSIKDVQESYLIVDDALFTV